MRRLRPSPSNPGFLRLSKVEKIHQDQIAQHGGQEGVCWSEGLESAIAAPQAGQSAGQA